MVASMTLLESRERYLQWVLDARFREQADISGNGEQGEEETRPRRLRTSPYEHYHIAESSRRSQDITAWLSNLVGDPAIEVSDSLRTAKIHTDP